MGLFVIGDLHLSLGGDKPMDIFSGWSNYVERLQNNWSALIHAEDTVVIAGDISWGMSLEQAKEDFAFIDKLAGRKILLKGNHDYWWTTKAKMESFFADNDLSTLHILHNNTYTCERFAICGTRGWINENGEPADQKVLLREAGRLQASLSEGEKTGLEPIAFLHYPPIFMDDENRPILEVLHRFSVKRCYYGHIHGKAGLKAVNETLGGIDYRLISCDFVDFSPVQIV